MEVKYNVTGDRRKALVQVISDITGARPVYKFMPTCNYEIDIFTVTKDGTLLFDDRSDSEEVEKVLDGIAAAGFECEAAQSADSGNTAAPVEDAEELPTEEPETAQGANSGDTAAPVEDAGELPTEEPETAQSADSGDTAALVEEAKELPTEEPDATQGADSANTAAPTEDTGLTVSLPMDGFTEDALDRLRKLVDSKAKLIRKALGAARLDIRKDAERVSFPWWDTLPEPEETQAFTAFVAAICAMAKTSKRVTAIEKDVESEKYAFRGFLLRLGFIGAGCKDQRKLLLKNLSGTSAFPNKKKADAFSAAQKAKRNAAKAAATNASDAVAVESGTEGVTA